MRSQPCALQSARALGDRGLAVAHRPVDLDRAVAEPTRQRSPSFSACARVMVFSGPSLSSRFQIAS